MEMAERHSGTTRQSGGNQGQGRLRKIAEFGVRQIALIMFSIIILLMSWEGQRVDSAAATWVGKGKGTQGQSNIPQDSIRLRILANSDRVSDQSVKRRVRDAVVEQMNSWVTQLDNPQSMDEAKTVINNNLSLIEKVVEQTLRSSGKDYEYQVELGVVPFPTKLYGGKVYPAGDYEALRITLGEGKGKNWWCVLFPPLCFVDAGSGDALAKDKELENAKNSSASNVDDSVQSVSATSEGNDTEVQIQASPEETEVRFFLWDMLVGMWDWITGLFA